MALRTRVLPLWLATFAAVAAAALLVNGVAIGTGSVPGLLVFLAWALVTSVYLTIRPAHLTAPAPAPATATA